MDTVEISNKFRNYLSNQRNNSVNLDSSYLKQLNREYQTQYDLMSEDEAINKFMNNMASYLKYILKEDGYFDNPSPPQDYLTNLATIGTHGITIYSGYIPQKYEKKFRVVAEKYLKQLFHLKNFIGFNLIFQYEYKTTCITTIRMTWDDNIKSLDTANYMPLDVISPTIYDPKHPDFEENVRRDVEKNVAELRYKLEKNIHLKHRRRKHTSKSKKPINQSINQPPTETRERKREPKMKKMIEEKEYERKNESDSGNEVTTSSEYGEMRYVTKMNLFDPNDKWITIRQKDAFEQENSEEKN